MKNIVLIGMPAVGKSTIGVLVAKSMLMSFVDTDLLLQEHEKASLCDIISNKGTDEFLKIENDIIKNHSFHNCVIATGGSAVYGKEAMSRLKMDSVIVYLQLSEAEIERRIKDISSRGVAMKNGDTIKDLYVERSPIYEKYADISVDCNGLSPEECVGKIIEKCKGSVL